MRAVVQRVARAAVWEQDSRGSGIPTATGSASSQGNLFGQIRRGLLVLLGIGKNDTPTDADWMINKLLNLRIFPDDAHNMNRSVTDISGEILVVSQFTLYGDARKGMRPGFTDAMPPAEAEQFYNDFMGKLRATTPLKVAEGKFAAMMDVELVNEGPVTIVLESLVVARASSLQPKVEQASSLSGENVEGISAQSRPQAKMPVQHFVPFDPTASVAISRRELPHWRQAGRTYFVTFRLSDSVPLEKLRQWQQLEDKRAVSERIHKWLDAGHGSCWLRQPEVSAVVENALRHFHGERYDLGAYVIMPNHVHVLVTPIGSQDLPEILHSWKSFTASEINRVLGRNGAFWQDESFDHLVRNEASLQQLEEYIRQNPVELSRFAEGGSTICS